MLNTTTRSALFLTLLAACEPSSLDQEPIQRDPDHDDAPSMRLSASAEAIILAVANTQDLVTLDEDVALDRRAATNILHHRSGSDEVPGTDDDVDFLTIDELDTTPYVGPVAMTKMYRWGLAEFGGSDERCDSALTVHGLREESPEARGVLAVANIVSPIELDDVVGLDRRAADGIVEARTAEALDCLVDLDEVAYVGESAITKLLDFASNNGWVLDEDDDTPLRIPDLDKCNDTIYLADGRSFHTLGQALHNARSEDTLYVCRGHYPGDVRFIRYESQLTIVGAGSGQTTLGGDSTRASSLSFVTGGLALRDVELDNAVLAYKGPRLDVVNMAITGEYGTVSARPHEPISNKGHYAFREISRKDCGRPGSVLQIVVSDPIETEATARFEEVHIERCQGAGIRLHGLDYAVVDKSSFVGVDTGLYVSLKHGHVTVSRSKFVGNDAGIRGKADYRGDSLTVTGSMFADNYANGDERKPSDLVFAGSPACPVLGQRAKAYCERTAYGEKASCRCK
ncbi:MAG: hypothetical protein ACI9MC_002971 [Kiritimatiellia bacterium]